MKKRDPNLEQFQHDMDGLTEKAQCVELAAQGLNAKETCKKLAISPETFRRWFDSDTEFRTAVYQNIVAVYLESPYERDW